MKDPSMLELVPIDAIQARQLTCFGLVSESRYGYGNFATPRWAFTLVTFFDRFIADDTPVHMGMTIRQLMLHKVMTDRELADAVVAAVQLQGDAEVIAGIIADWNSTVVVNVDCCASEAAKAIRKFVEPYYGR